MPAAFSWPFVVEVPVRFRDLDPFGHVNNAVYVTYLEQARTECYLALCGRTDPVEAGAGLDFVVARAEIDYLAPVRAGDVLSVAVRPERVGETSFTLAYDVRGRSGAAVARGRTVCVCFDHARSAKKPVPEALRERLEAGIARSGP